MLKIFFEIKDIKKKDPRHITMNPDEDNPVPKFVLKVPIITPATPKAQARIIITFICLENKNAVAEGMAMNAMTRIAPTDSKAATHVKDNIAMIL